MKGRDVVFTYSSASSTHHKSQAQKVPFDLQVFLYLSWHADSTQIGLMWKWKDASLLFHFSSLCKCKRFLEGCFPCYRIFENLLPEANKSVKGVPNGHISHIFYKSH